ncbi:MAG: winged helix-turn-helix transcriptional regulator [Nocardioides sp.]|nr:winged helix-turn-helix transcriptional regulator [Nocardioides sp.]
MRRPVSSRCASAVVRGWRSSSSGSDARRRPRDRRARSRLRGVSDEVRWLDTNQQRSWRALVMGMTLLNDRLDSELRQGFDLSLPEYEVLVRLSENDGAMRMAQLADAMAHSRSRVTHTIARMERAGLVERRTSLSDGRGVVAMLTDKGMALLVEAAPSHVASVRAHLVDLCTDEDFAALGRVMNAVSDQLVGDRPSVEMRDVSAS